MKKNNIVGMLCVSMSVFLMISADALYKYMCLPMNIPLLQCLLVANLVQHLFAWILWFMPSSITKKPDHITKWYGESESRFLIWLRGLFYFGDDFFYWIGLSRLPLGDAECIYFLCPIFIAFGARLFLKETFSRTFPFIISLTAIGVTILCQPRWLTDFLGAKKSGGWSSEELNPVGVTSLVAGCMCWAAMNLMVRRIPKAHWTQLELTSSLLSFAVLSPLAIGVCFALKIDEFSILGNAVSQLYTDWQGSLTAIGICAAIGTLSVLSFMFLVVGYQRGEATKVSWLEYMNVPIGYVYQYFLQPPINGFEIVGAAIILTTGVVEIAAEWYHYRQTKVRLSLLDPRKSEWNDESEWNDDIFSINNTTNCEASKSLRQSLHRTRA